MRFNMPQVSSKILSLGDSRSLFTSRTSIEASVLSDNWIKEDSAPIAVSTVAGSLSLISDYS
jgi:hypothetical protein